MKILFASDMSFNYFKGFPGKEKAYDTMKEIAAEFAAADFGVVNLENIFGNREEYKPIPKSGPNLISDNRFLEYVNAIKPAVVNLANNHSKDYGEEAMFDTMSLLKSNGYKVIGAGENIDAAYQPAILEKDDVKCAIIGVCENEFGVADKNTSGVAGYNLSMVYNQIQKAVKNGEYPIIYFHGGNEHDPFPSPGKTELYRLFIDFGAKAVIAMHTHCTQGYEEYKGCPIIYSMGNFFFPKDKAVVNKAWHKGYMTLVNITHDNLDFEVIPYKFDFDEITLLKGEELVEFKRYLDILNEPIKDSKKIAELFDAWCMEAGKVYSQFIKFNQDEFENYTAENISPLKNLFSCEAHDELMNNTLKVIYEGKADEAKKGLGKIKALQNMEY